MPWIFLFLFLVPAYGQTIATTEDGEKVMLFQDGTWRTMGEASLSTAEVGLSNLVYVEVIKSASTFTGLYGTPQRSDFEPSTSEISLMLQKHSVKTTMKEKGSRMTLRVEKDTWSIIDASGELLYYEKDPAFQFTNRIKDAANVIKQLLM